MPVLMLYAANDTALGPQLVRVRTSVFLQMLFLDQTSTVGCLFPPAGCST